MSMRLNKLSVASGSIVEQSKTGSSSEHKFPLVLSADALDAEKNRLDAVVEKLVTKKADKEAILEAVSELHMAALTSYRYWLNYRIDIKNEDGDLTGEVVDTLVDQNPPVNRSTGRPIRLGLPTWLNSFDNNTVQRLASVDVKRQAFFDQIEADYQESRASDKPEENDDEESVFDKAE